MKKLLYILFLFTPVFAIGQQTPLHSQYIFDRVLINPAYAGSSSYILSSLNVRQQLTGIEGSPKTETFSFHAPIQSKYMGLGLKVLHDHLGINDNLSVYGIYSYQIGFGNGKLSFGIEGGIVNNSMDFSNIIANDNVNDLLIPLEKKSIITPDASFGMYFNTDNLYVGYSIYHLIGGEIKYTNTYLKNPEFNKHHYLTAGYETSISEKISFEPSALFKKTKSAPAQIDILTNFKYNNQFSFGLLYRSGDAVSMVLGFHLKDKYFIGYAYDYSISELSSYTSGGHEIMIRYSHKLLPPAAQKEVHPIYYIRE